MWRGFEPRERPVRPTPVKGLTSDSIVPHAPIDSLSFSVFDHARILTSGVWGPRANQLTLLLPACTRCLGAIFCVFEGIAFVVRKVLRLCAAVVYVFALGYVLYFVVSYLLSAWRDFRVSMNRSSWVEVVPGPFLRSRFRIVLCN